jgi:head-tail adaptor
MSVGFPAGRLDKTIHLTAPGIVPDGTGGYVEDMTDLIPADVSAQILPATARDLERNAAGGIVTASATHLVTIWYHPGVTTKAQITYDDRVAGRVRTFSVAGVRNPEEANVILVLTCEEVIA